MNDETPTAGSENEAVILHRDFYRQLLDARARLAEVERERDAYKRAKQENDERFMIERDEARTERDRYRNLLERAVKYATEDRAVTPGTTRLARLLDEARAALYPVEPAQPAQPAHRSRHRVGYVSMGLPCFYCTAKAGEECRDEPDKRAPTQPEAPKVDPLEAVLAVECPEEDCGARPGLPCVSPDDIPIMFRTECDMFCASRIRAAARGGK